MSLVDIIRPASLLVDRVILALSKSVLRLAIVGNDGTEHGGLEVGCDRSKNLCSLMLAVAITGRETKGGHTQRGLLQGCSHHCTAGRLP